MTRDEIGGWKLSSLLDSNLLKSQLLLSLFVLFSIESFFSNILNLAKSQLMSEISKERRRLGLRLVL